MNLLVRVVEQDGKLVFRPENPGEWIVQDDPECPKELISLEGACDAELESVNWNLQINEGAQKICCYLSKGASSVVYALRAFRYRPGTLILDDVREMTDPLDAKVKTFRSQEFQELMDKYNFQVADFYCKRFMFWGADTAKYYEEAYTEKVISDGEVKVFYGEDGKVQKFKPKKHVHWMLEIIRHKDGVSRVLHTNVMSLQRLEKCLRKHEAELMD